MESLENRIVLAAVAGSATIVDGELIVCGDGAANTIVVAELANNFFVAADFLTTPQLFPKAEVTSLRVAGGDGNDTLVASSLQRPIILEGNAGADRMFGGQSADRLEGGAGDDLIYGSAGNDVVLGGDGLDRVFAGDGNDIVNGGDDDDLLQGNQGDDILNGESGNDQVAGSGGSDTVLGGVGNDTLLGGAGNDLLRGNAGNDTLVGEGDADELLGEVGDDTLLGSGGNDHLLGGPGSDLLVGGNGDDFLEGEDGVDRLFGDSGTDVIDGGFGNDQAFGGSGPDTIFGNDGNDELNGGIGFDVLAGQDGSDTIYGGDFQDVLIGGRGTDQLQGQASEDLLIGGTVDRESDAAALDVIRSVWTSSQSFDQRVANALHGVAVIHDSSADQLVGGNGRDAFFAGSSGEASGRDPNEPFIDQALAAADDTFELAIGETIATSLVDGVFSNDSLIGGGEFSLDIVTPPSHGPVQFNSDGTFAYTQSTHGRDSFVYQITTQTGGTSQATVHIIVPNLPPLPVGEFLTTTTSGLQFYDFSLGTGATPVRANTVTVDYVGYLPNGMVFDSNSTINFPLAGVITGFAEGIEGMRVGGIRRIVIPPNLGYGPGGNPGAGIGGTDVITFDVTLHAIVS